MRVFDFDNTIYKGESVIDFFLFSLERKKWLIKYAPTIVQTAILYKMNILSIEKLTELAGRLSKVVLENKEEADKFIKEFWELHQQNLKEEYLNMIEPEDVIISACPRILIDGIKDKLNTNNIICSELNLNTGKLDFICYKENKVQAFKKTFPNKQIDEFYTDSLSDKPLMEISKTTYLIKK